MTPPPKDAVPTRRAPRDAGDDAPVAARVVRDRTRVGRYDLLFELARGGMGTVHVARAADAHGLGRLVALKTLPPGRFDADDLAAFVAEARITSHVNHPNVVQCFDFGTDEGSPYLVMQLVEGPSLSRLLHVLGEQGERLPVETAVWIALQIAEGLDAAHELTGEDGAPLGLVHRDVSPQNVLVSHTGRVFVADFGIAKLLEADRVTRSGELKGKLGYMSPEQTRGEILDRRTDVFAFGAVLHEMLTGTRPFAAASPAEAVYRINNVDVPRLRTLRPEVPEAIEVLVGRCLARDRDERPETMKSIAAELRRSLRGAGHSVDESDLATLLARVLPGERESLRARVRAATAGEPQVGETGPAPFAAEPAFPSATLTASALPGVAEQRRSLRWVGALLVLVLVAGLVLVLRSGAPADTGSTSATAPARSSPAPSAPASETADAAPTASSDASSVAPPILVATPTSSTSSGALPTRPASPRPPPTARPSASASPAATSHKGEPFRGL